MKQPSPDEVRREVLAMYGLPALLLAFFLQPDVTAANPDNRAALAAVAVGALISFELLFQFVEARLWRISFTAVILLTSGRIADGFLNSAKHSSRANEARCLAIQHDMLSAQPRRTDSPDLFQSLGCRPQGEGSVYAPPTARERSAGKPLPHGGNAPPQ